MENFINVKNLVREYKVGENIISAVNDISFKIKDGEFTVILGPSGSGKSTLLNIIGGMDKGTSGSVIVDGQDISNYSSKELNEYRRKKVGFVFQFYNLLPNLNAKENVDVSKKIADNPMDSEEALREVGLGDRLDHFPGELSGGEQQRVSIARAICKNPTLLLCDEPTGALDSETGKIVLTTLEQMCRKNGHSIIIVTHNQLIAKAADRVIHLRDGKVIEVEENKSPVSISEVNW